MICGDPLDIETDLLLGVRKPEECLALFTISYITVCSKGKFVTLYSIYLAYT